MAYAGDQIPTTRVCLMLPRPRTLDPKPSIHFLGAVGDANNVASDADLDERIHKLNTSYLAQSTAMLAKTAHIQRRRWCSNCCMCFCPTFSILICMLLQWGLVEMLLFKDGMVGSSLNSTLPPSPRPSALPQCSSQR
jgi:hypothetical protein